MRYLYNINENKVVCVSHFAGKAVRGIAKCDTTCDDFDVIVGRKLAMLRCDEKVAKKRVKRAEEKLKDAIRKLEDARKELVDMQIYLNDAVAIYEDASAARIDFEKTLA